MPISEFPGWGSGWISDGAVSFYNDYPVQVNQRGPSFQLTIQVWQGASYQAALLSPFLGEGSITWTEPGVIPNDAAETFRGFPDTPIYVTPEPNRPPSRCSA